MTVTLPSLGRMALALAMIAAAFFGGLALGHSHRPAARTIAPGGPVPL